MTVHAWLPVPVRVQVEPSTLLKVVKPVYWVPMRPRSKVPVPGPPSWNVSVPPAMTLPVDDAGRRDRQGVAGAEQLNRGTVHPDDRARIEHGRAGRGQDRCRISADDAAHIVDDVAVIELDRDAEVAGDGRYRAEIGDRGRGYQLPRNGEAIPRDDAGGVVDERQ
jgi:hypothetical protein